MRVRYLQANILAGGSMKNKEALRILLVDDDKDLLDLLKYNFEKEGFVVKTVSKIRKAIPAAQEFRPELIILDVAMPDGDGISLCRDIRGLRDFHNTFIFFLSARSENTFKEKAFAIGADDFIEKLSGLRALTNKVNAVLKNRFVIKKGVSTLAWDNLLVNHRSEVAYLNDKELTLSKPEFEILFFLMQNPNKVVSRKNLVKIIWGSEVFVLESSVRTCIENLRGKIGARFIEKLADDQYRFNQRNH